MASQTIGDSFICRVASANKLPYSGKIWWALNLAKWLYWRNLNLAICTCNCAYDAFSACMAYASSLNVRIENEDFDVENCI